MRKKNYFYVDMDGVLADFMREPNAVERFANEPNFFVNLKPIIENVNAIRELIARHESVRVLSISPNARSDKEKKMWLAKYIPEITATHIIIIRTGESKVEHMATQNGILFDDYGKNIREWITANGNQGCKIDKEMNIQKWCEKMGW